MKKLILISSILLIGCYTPKKAVKQSIKAYVEYPKEVAELHSKWYPINTTKVVEKEYIQGKDSVIIDTIEVDCSNIPDTVEKVVKVPYIKQVGRVDTFRMSTIDSIENTAKIEALQYQIDELDDLYNKERTKNAILQSKISNKNKTIAILSTLLGLILLGSFVYLWVKKNFKLV